MSRKLISFDWAIKKILRSKANFGILEGFLSELLFTDITILDVLESESNQESEDNKFNRVDIKVTDSEKRILIIEIQYSRELDYLQRILFASSRTITEHSPALSRWWIAISCKCLIYGYQQQREIYYLADKCP